jgi:chromosome segregation ATPase
MKQSEINPFVSLAIDKLEKIEEKGNRNHEDYIAMQGEIKHQSQRITRHKAEETEHFARLEEDLDEVKKLLSDIREEIRKDRALQNERHTDYATVMEYVKNKRKRNQSIIDNSIKAVIVAGVLGALTTWWKSIKG